MVDCRGPANEARLPLLSSGGPAGATTGLQRAVAARQQTCSPPAAFVAVSRRPPALPAAGAQSSLRPGNPARCRPPPHPAGEFPRSGAHCNYCPARLCAGVLRTVRRTARRQATVLLRSCCSFAAAAEAYSECQRDAESGWAGCYELLAVVVRRLTRYAKSRARRQTVRAGRGRFVPWQEPWRTCGRSGGSRLKVQRRWLRGPGL